MSISRKNKEDLLKSFELLGFFIKSFEEGNINLYLPMAVELRKLLCEKDPSPLITRVIPEFKLYKLNSTMIFGNSPALLNGLENFMPGRISVKNGVTIFALSFSPKMEPMRINDWTNQMFFKENISICELIKSVADKEAAHSDKNYNGTLIHCRSWSYNDVSCYILGIYGIAQFVYSVFIHEYNNLT